MAKPLLTTIRVVTVPEVQCDGTPENLTIQELPDGKVRLMIGEQELVTCLRTDLLDALNLLK